MSMTKLNSLAKYLVKAYASDRTSSGGHGGIQVNPIVAEIASWYERLRNAMEYREEEVILRAAIERILKRRLILGGSGTIVAIPLVRELVWARYFPDGSISEATVEKVQNTIDLYLKLREVVIHHSTLKEPEVNEWTYQLMSSHLEDILHPEPEKETMINFMFHILKERIIIVDDSEETRDIQVFIAIRKSYSKNDIALLRYHLFRQLFGELTQKTLEDTAEGFVEGRKQIEKELSYPKRHKILGFVKKHTPPFLILDDMLISEKENIPELLENPEYLSKTVFDICQKRYNTIATKVKRAIVRSVIFLLLSKAIFAFVVEGTYENFFYGKILWSSMALNIVIPPLLMIVVGLSIKTPDRKNSERILQRINTLLFDPNPSGGAQIKIRLSPKKTRSVLDIVFSLLWAAAFILSFGLVIFILSKLHFNIVSQGVFTFFLAIVTFLAFRIYRTAHLYTVVDKQGILTPIIDFFFMPVAQVGRYLTEGISQINIFLFLFDFIIEAPFKGMFGFFEQWFLYLHTKRENLE